MVAVFKDPKKVLSEPPPIRPKITEYCQTSGEDQRRLTDLENDREDAHSPSLELVSQYKQMENMGFRAEERSLKTRTLSELTLEEDPSAVGGSENVDRVVSFVQLGRLSTAPTISLPRLSEIVARP